MNPAEQIAALERLVTWGFGSLLGLLAITFVLALGALLKSRQEPSLPADPPRPWSLHGETYLADLKDRIALLEEQQQRLAGHLSLCAETLLALHQPAVLRPILLGQAAPPKALLRVVQEERRLATERWRLPENGWVDWDPTAEEPPSQENSGPLFDALASQSPQWSNIPLRLEQLERLLRR